MKTGLRFKTLTLARREASLILCLGSALALNTLVLAADSENNLKPTTNTSDKSSTEVPMPTPSPVDQAHVMADVGYHFANLWFAVDNRNWPLAKYYLGETRSHLSWAVSIHPVRKTSAGAEVDLKGILDAVDNSFLSEVAKAIDSKDTAKFKTAYQQTLVGCYACHSACEKPFLRLQVPTAPAATIINFIEPTNGPKLSSHLFDSSAQTAPVLIMEQAPKRATRFEFFGGGNPGDDLDIFGEVNPAQSPDWPLFSIHF